MVSYHKAFLCILVYTFSYHTLRKIILRILKYIGITLAVLVIAVIAFFNFHPTFGGSPSESSMKVIKASKNYDGEKFVNLIETKLETGDPENRKSIMDFIGEMLNPPEGKVPNEELPTTKFEAKQLIENSFVWMGHSTILMNLDGVTVLADPVFHNASPIPGTVTPFEMEHKTTITDLPEKIDVVIISHDHYDHLDYKAIQKLDDRVGTFLVPLGLKAHLERWGVDESKIQEKDWKQSVKFKTLTFTMTPARHFSGRGLFNRYSTLWCSWVIKSSKLNVFFNGDSGYFGEFKEIGKQYGPFDIAFIENGAYDKDWSEIHMMPEESVQANIDLQSKLMFPIHWGKFDLANHTWDEPIIRTIKESELKNVNIATPQIGQVFTLDNIPQTKWWEMVHGSKE